MASATNITGAIMSMGSLTDGKLATLPVVKGASPFQRLIGTEVSARDVRIIEDAGSVKFQVNTGTEGAPTWVTVFWFDWGANVFARFTHNLTTGHAYTLPDRDITVAGLDETALFPALTNRTGGTLASGDIVALDTATDASVVLSDAPASAAFFVVSLDAPAQLASGRFKHTGQATAKVQGAVTRGHWLQKSATTKALEDTGLSYLSGVPRFGTCAIALENAAGPGSALIRVDLLGFTWWLPTFTAKGTLLAASSADNLSTLGVGGNGTVLTADAAATVGLKWATPVTVFTTEFVSADQTVAFSSALNVAHGLGVKPKLVQVTLKCATAEGGYSVGDELPILGSSTNVQNFQPDPTISVDITNVSIITSTGIKIVHKTTFAAFVITAANWKYVVRAWV